MRENFDEAFSLVIKHEGGYVNNPKDPGGMTNLGVTKKVWEEYVGHEVDEMTMRNLSINDVKPLYKKMYWDKIRGDDLPEGLDYAAFDFSVNSGTGRAAKFLQRIVGANQDGAIGPATLKALEACNASELVTELCEERQKFLESLPIFPTFGKGWTARVSEVEKHAFQMATA